MDPTITRSEQVGRLPGRLILVVGPSGVGKDTLLAGARTELVSREDVIFPRREITRGADTDGEDHLPVQPAAFAARRRAGRYALAWEAHGLGYGIGAAIESDLAAGRHVVVNVSRTVLDDARQRFPRVRIVHVVASPDVLRARLLERGREDAQAVERRVERATAVRVAGDDVVEVRNDSDPVEGVRRFLAALDVPAVLPLQR